MFETELSGVKASLAEAFGKIYDLFEDVNMPEHRNETLCFCGVSGYTVKGLSADAEGGVQRSLDAEFLCELWGKRGMGAEALSEELDQKVLPALGLCAGEIKSIKREKTRFSRESGGYIASAVLSFSTSAATTAPEEKIDVNVSGISCSGFHGFEIKNSVRVAETPLISGEIISRRVGVSPSRLTLFGSLRAGGAELYGQLKPLLGTVCAPLSAAGISFVGMMMSGLTLKGGSDGYSELEAEFTEVNDQ